MKITGRITWEDIKGGKPLDPEGCPLATATARAIPSSTHVSVIPGNVAIVIGGVNWLAETSKQLEEWVEDYDCGVPQQPRKFQLTFMKFG